MTKTRGKRAASERARRSPLRRFLAFVFVLALLAAFFWTQQNILASEEFAVGPVPEAFAGLRIAVLSDLHGKEFGEGNERLLEKLRLQRPDLIAMTGDFVHKGVSPEYLRPLIAGLTAIAPTYYVTRNHEWATGQVQEIKALLEAGGVDVLSNEYRLLEREGQKIALMGADDSNGRADQKTIAEMADEVRAAEGQDCYLLLLSHRNNRFETYAEARIDLTLSGHAHGGQIRLPFTDGLIGPHREFLPDHTAGIYPLSYGQMFVSRGLSDQVPAFRLFNRPHMPLLILQAAA